MRIDVCGIGFETPTVTFYLWSPWRASMLEHKLFDALRALPAGDETADTDEIRWKMPDAKLWPKIMQNCTRILKGWQEDAAPGGTEKRTWRWLLEADADFDGYDHAGEKAGMWGFLRVSVDRGTLGEAEKGEDIDLNAFGFQIHNLSDPG